MQAKLSEVDQRVSTALEQVKELRAAEAETLAAVNAESEARDHAQESNAQTFTELEARIIELVRGLKSSRAALWLALSLLLAGQVVVAILVILG